MARDFRLLDLARAVNDEIQDLLRRARPQLRHHSQLEDSADGIPANIREAYGRRKGPERNQYLRVARSCSGESDDHLRSNWKAQRIDQKKYFQLHNKLDVILKMITRIIENSS